MADNGLFAGDGRVHADYGGRDSMVRNAQDGVVHAGDVSGGFADLRVCTDFRDRADAVGHHHRPHALARAVRLYRAVHAGGNGVGGQVPDG